jgi:DNA-binding transcriptional ArsR family regulator
MNFQPFQTSPDPLNAAFAALADPTRRAILARLALGETSVGDLIQPFAISGPAISRHLRVLENARLIERKVDAQWRICRLNPPGLRVANDWLQQYREFWEHSLDRLVEVLEQAEGIAAPAAVKPGRQLNRNTALGRVKPMAIKPGQLKPRNSASKTRKSP